MSIKKRIDQEAYDALESSDQKYYVKDGDGYRFEVTAKGDDLKDEVVRLKQDLETERGRTAKAIKDFDKFKNKIESDKARSEGDIDSLDSQWKAKYEKLEREKEADAQRFDKYRSEQALDKVITKMAMEVSTSPEVFSLVLKDRLRHTVEKGKDKVYVVDEQGERTAQSPEEFVDSLRSNESYGRLLKAKDPDKKDQPSKEPALDSKVPQPAPTSNNFEWDKLDVRNSKTDQQKAIERLEAAYEANKLTV